ncbi:serine acetyltransferase [Lactiplantibacillus fabifermentans]|uniref:Serine acetyltransferase n=2 Tax=Lactiplantibacillus fabifermentans TaxID=483011 RepID=A0A0R2NLF9_9LACO|nr:serine acetyltransferase [Lactiplantibacillus fabifermentans]ETY75643.1 serine acetyltransferase [Lactiplantibacillus fabifermentans T30PCM01]KRO26581.1 hypothetical protein DY78_GL000798 [Lactiplantibacillus fabifermentans DSM 21115]
MTNFNTLLHQNCFATTPAERQAAANALERDFNCEVQAFEIDPSVQFAHHGRGCTIAAAKICAGVVIFQNVTVGANQKFNLQTQQWEQLGNPVIGQNVIIADGAKVLGPIIIGDNTVIGAGAIITKDVPANQVAYGVNQFKPRDPQYDLIYHDPMPDFSDLQAAGQAVIDRYTKKSAE